MVGLRNKFEPTFFQVLGIHGLGDEVRLFSLRRHSPTTLSKYLAHISSVDQCPQIRNFRRHSNSRDQRCHA